MEYILITQLYYMMTYFSIDYYDCYYDFYNGVLISNSPGFHAVHV